MTSCVCDFYKQLGLSKNKFMKKTYFQIGEEYENSYSLYIGLLTMVSIITS